MDGELDGEDGAAEGEDEDGVEVLGKDGYDDSDEERQDGKQRAGKRNAPAESRRAAQTQEGDEQDEEEQAGPLSAAGGSENGKRADKDKNGFEVVPQQKRKKGDDSDGSGTDSDDEFDALDDQGKAEVLALAKRMLHRKDKESIMDAAYNRYAFHDTGMPRWFAEDEARHMKPIMPVTKEEVEAEKARLKAVDARPIKKVAEAKARQHRKAVSRLQGAREKAEAIAAQEDVPMNSKMREIERIYARARAGGKKGKGGKDDKKNNKKGKGKGKGPPMDKRMLKDKRAAKAQEKRSKGKKGKGRGKK
ncbi:Spb1 C-terminal domain-containing protein [Dunaliella salina]|uniref:Spb1 C-terminal domain-containing protein n=1 Tax=Dunaliella salina TaxID=3046 RepID=A0ABQ7GGT0_DUNSA|nr:Spb1 C-terminal domain-containing protein [Dunaliella salina]|eukprot:KAF5833810.1 Spb1 C-terminal domain-containing protein [Dunaliella salina]